MTFEWEIIYEFGENRTYRAKVFKGWLVSSNTYEKKGGLSEAMCFIPDPTHEWEIEK